MLRWTGLAVGLAAIFATPTLGGVRFVRSGVVSFSFEEDFINFFTVAGLTFDEFVSTAPPRPGFDLGLRVLESSDFSIGVIDGEFVSFRDGRLNTEGGARFTIPGSPLPFDLDAFSFIYDAEHEPEAWHALGAIRVVPFFEQFSSMADFTPGPILYDDATGQLSITELTLVISQEAASDILAAPDLAGAPFGRARIDIQMIIPSGDGDDDTDVDVGDYGAYRACHTGPDAFLEDAACRIFDFDDDRDVDLLDLGGVQRRYTGPLLLVNIDATVEPFVDVDVTPPDFFDLEQGTTPFRRSYKAGDNVTLTAPENTLLSGFVRWNVNGIDQADGQDTITLSMEQPQNAVAVYERVTSELFVESSGVFNVPITASPADVFESEGATTEFTLVYPDDTEVTLTAPAEWDGRFLQQWEIDGAPGVVAEQNATFTISEFTTATAVYRDIVILKQPQSLAQCEGLPGELSVVALGNNLSYQWLVDDEPIAGATSATLSFESIGPDQTGPYRVEISSPFATVTSEVAFIGVAQVPQVTSNPIGGDFCPGDNVLFFVSAMGTSPEYQWLFNGDEIPGATSFFYSFDVVDASQAGAYAVRVTNNCGETVSQDAIVTIDIENCP